MPTRDVLLLVTEWGVWSSSDNRHLYQTLRQHYGDHTDLKEKPCHCFSFDEQEILLDFLYLAILAGWDFYLFSYHHSGILFVSHDEFATYFSRDRVQFIHNKVQLFFDDWKGNEIGQQLNS